MLVRTTYRPVSLGNEFGDFDTGDIVGGDGALLTRDGDSSYIETARGTTPDLRTEVSFRLVAENAPPPSGATLLSITMDIEMRKTEDSTAPTIVTNVFAAPYEGVWGTLGSAFTASTDYVYFEDRMVQDFVSMPWNDVLGWAIVNQEPDYYWRMSTLVPDTGTFAYGRVTYLRVHVNYEGGGERPLRWRQRNDRFASGAPSAARGVRTMQGSIRGRGIY